MNVKDNITITRYVEVERIAQLIRQKQTEEAVRLIQENFSNFLEFLHALIQVENEKIKRDKRFESIDRKSVV